MSNQEHEQQESMYKDLTDTMNLSYLHNNDA